MKTRKTMIMLGLIITSILSATVISAIAQPVPLPEPMPIEVPPPPQIDQNYTKLQISPRHEFLRIKPGDTKEIKVTVKNMENKTVSTEVKVVIPPYGENILDTKWITVTPSNADIQADEKQEYTIKVEIPEDATLGHYSASIAFTNDTFPTPYPVPYPKYINSFELSVKVWKEPTIRIYTRY
ncbi:MAG: hypothetical protein ACE5KE_10615, partial [Methanosarcinales archaeon]